MEQQDILNGITDIKSIIVSTMERLVKSNPGGMPIEVLDTEAKDKYNVLQECLLKLEAMKQNLINDIDTITPLSGQLLIQMENLYDKKMQL